MFRVPENVFREVEQCFGRKQVLVVGDLMLDVYLWGRVDRISPEAPVPVVKLDRRSTGPGGSGNTSVQVQETCSPPFPKEHQTVIYHDLTQPR